MDTLIKNVDEGNWHYLKVEAAKERKTIGQLFNRIILEYQYKRKEKGLQQLETVLSRPPLLTNDEARRMQKTIRNVRKEYGFEG